eukprot:2021604-Prymnesium_polylepis.1
MSPRFTARSANVSQSTTARPEGDGCGEAVPAMLSEPAPESKELDAPEDSAVGLSLEVTLTAEAASSDPAALEGAACSCPSIASVSGPRRPPR